MCCLQKRMLSVMQSSQGIFSPRNKTHTRTELGHRVHITVGFRRLERLSVGLPCRPSMHLPNAAVRHHGGHASGRGRRHASGPRRAATRAAKEATRLLQRSCWALTGSSSGIVRTLGLGFWSPRCTAVVPRLLQACSRLAAPILRSVF